MFVLIDGSKTYDTFEIRRVARIVQGVAISIQALRSSSINPTMADLGSGFLGESADELQNQLGALGDGVVSLSNGLNQISSSLFAYAKRLEEIDAEAAQNIRSH